MMKPYFIFSKRLLYASLFSVAVIGTAIYISQNEPSSESVERTTNSNIYTSTDTIKETDTNTSTQTELSKTSNNQDVTPAISQNAKQTTYATSTDDEQKLTETDKLTRNILQPYFTQVSRNQYSPEQREQIVQNATKEMFTLAFTPLKPKDIRTLEDSSKQSVIAYKKALYEALKPIFTLDEYELNIYARAVRDNDKETFDSLKTIADIYKQSGDAVLAIPAPNEVSEIHLEIINALYKFSMVLEKLAKGYDDPAASLSGTGNFTEAEESIQQAFIKLKTYFILKDVDKISV